MECFTQFKQFHNDGYTVIPCVFNRDETASLIDRLQAALAADEHSVLRSRGHTYRSRDLIRLLPEICEIPRRTALGEFIEPILGKQAGLVRALFFDKPPERGWSLPWHKDCTIAVKRNDLASTQFQRPTLKAGIPHVEAPESLLSTMLTLRVHLDAMTPENGPLSVIPGSHRPNNESAPPVEINTAAGDVFAMRPLLSHASSESHQGTTMHRRVIHLELAPSAALADGYQWHTFVPIR